jgi:hypothetical protein
MSEPVVVYLQDQVQMRKPHPCGSVLWQVVRLGADIGLVCLGCQRRVLLSRREFEKNLKKIVLRGDPNLTNPASDFTDPS